VARRVAGGEQGQLGRACPYPRLGGVLRCGLFQGRPGAPATVRDRRGRRRDWQGVAAPPVPLRDRHPELGPPRRPRYGPTAGCGDIDTCRTPCICERLSTPSTEGHAPIMLRGATTLKTAEEASRASC